MIPLLQLLTLASHPCVAGMIEAHDVAQVGLCLEVARAEQDIGVPAWQAGRMGRTAAWMADELLKDGRLTPDEIAGILTIGRGESALDPTGRSHSALPDEAQGGSHGPLQMTDRTAKWLGVDSRRLRARRRSDLPAQARASRYAASAAMTFYSTRTSLARRHGLRTHFEALRHISRSPEQSREEMWASWAAGCSVRVRNAGEGLQRTLVKRRAQFPRYQKAVAKWLPKYEVAQPTALATAALMPSRRLRPKRSVTRRRSPARRATDGAAAAAATD